MSGDLINEKAAIIIHHLERHLLAIQIWKLQLQAPITAYFQPSSGAAEEVGELK